jgi:hypothetical protein
MFPLRGLIFKREYMYYPKVTETSGVCTSVEHHGRNVEKARAGEK